METFHLSLQLINSLREKIKEKRNGKKKERKKENMGVGSNNILVIKGDDYYN